MFVFIIENRQCGQPGGWTHSVSESKGWDPSATAVTADNSKMGHRANNDGKFQSTRLKSRHSGWSKGIQQEHDSRKTREGKIRFNKRGNFPNGEFVLFGCSIPPPPGNMAELESFKPWLGKVVEVVQETKLEFGLVWWWERETQ